MTARPPRRWRSQDDGVTSLARVVHFVDDRLAKRMMRTLLRVGFAPRAFALLETKGAAADGAG